MRTLSVVLVCGLLAASSLANAQSAATDTASGKASATRDPNTRGAGSSRGVARSRAASSHRTLRHHAVNAYAQAPAGGQSEMEMRQGCYAYAKQQVPSGNQDKQKDRDFMYSTCAFDHGIMP